ncbi:CocE/NonD family hydrolase [Acidobacteriota bacterium]
MKQNLKWAFPLILSFLFLAALFVPLFSAGTEKSVEIEMILDQKIAMKDGIHLIAKIWKPAKMEKPLPVVFALTPYIADEGQKWGPFFVRNGYVYVHVDCRGRGNSEGDFYPGENDGVDGAQVIDWIGKQSWCDGQVTMRGGSYRGMVQWQALMNFPKALKTIVPTASGAPGIDFPWPNNIGATYFAQWLGYTMGKTENIDLFTDGKYWGEKYYKMYSEHIPFSKLAKITGSNQKIFQRWVSHPTYDEFWKKLTPSAEQYAQMDIPILTITGHFDGDQHGAMHYYFGHLANSSEEAQSKHYLLMGPWDHAGTRKPKKKLGDMVFGDNSVLNIDKLHVEWYDWTLKGKEQPELLKKRITYYMMNADEWRYADSLEEVANSKMTWYLSSKEGRANDIFKSGKLVPNLPEGELKPDIYEYDPLKLISKEEYFAGAENIISDEQDKLIYHSPPLQEDIEVAGYVKFKAYIELNVPDTDFGVALYEIRSDGKSITLGQDFMRARYRNFETKEELVKPGDINLYEFKTFYWFARRLEKGSRIRLIISSLNTPSLQKNYNSGGVVAEETAKDSRTATIKLYHDPKYPSTLEIPIIEKK